LTFARRQQRNDPRRKEEQSQPSPRSSHALHRKTSQHGRAKSAVMKNPDAEPSVDGCLLMLRLFEGVAAAVSVVLFLSWLFFCRAAFFVVADSHSNNFATRCLFPSRHPLIAICCRFRRAAFSSWLIATPTICQSLIASRHSPPFNSPVAIRYSLPFSLVGQFAG